MKRFTVVLLAALVLGGATATALAQQQVIIIGTNPVTTASYAAGAAMALVMNYAGLNTAVQPHGGSGAILPLVNSGEIDFAIDFAPSSVQAWRGPGFRIAGTENRYQHAPNLRLVMRLGHLKTGLVAQRDAGISSIVHLRGKRVPWKFPASPLSQQIVVAGLQSAGLEERDVTPVPVSGIGDSTQALKSGRVDVAVASVGAAMTREADAAIGIRYLNFDCSPPGIELVRRNFPGLVPTVIRGGSDPTVPRDTCVPFMTVYLVTRVNFPAQTLERVLQALWDGSSKLSATAPLFKEWTREEMADPIPNIPYHPATVKFFQGKSLWSPALEARQKELLAMQ